MSELTVNTLLLLDWCKTRADGAESTILVDLMFVVVVVAAVMVEALMMKLSELIAMLLELLLLLLRTSVGVMVGMA